MDKVFRGWIPTVSGRLSFSIFGDAQYPSTAKNANVADDVDRYIICTQKRKSLDIALPLKYLLAKTLFNLEGTFWCVCLAKCTNSFANSSVEGLKGKLIIFHNRVRWKLFGQPDVVAAQSLLNNYNPFVAHKKLSEYFEEEYRSLLNNLHKDSSFYVDFELERDGIVTLIIPENLEVYSNAPSFPEDEHRKNHLLHVLTSQLFFFLRDLAHRHQHHDPKTDTILSVYPYDKDDADSDVTWRCETLRSLYRRVLEYKRVRKEVTYCSSLGVLAYAKSFKIISSNVLSGKHDLQPHLNEDTLEFSIKASQEATRNSIQNDIRKSDTIRNTLIGVIGIVLTLVSLINLTGITLNIQKPSPILTYIAEGLIKEPLYSLAIMTLFVIVLLVIFKVIDVADWSWTRGIIRLVQPLHKNVAFLLTFGVAILFAYLIYKFINII